MDGTSRLLRSKQKQITTIPKVLNMQRIIALLVCILCCTSAFSQAHYNRLLTQSASWDKSRINNVLNKKLDSLPNYLKDRYYPLISYANEHYDVTFVFHATLSCVDSLIDISIANNDFPLDLYYTTNRCGRCKVKLVVLTYQGEVEIVDTGFVSFMRGLADKEDKAFRYIQKQQPDLVFVCKDIYGCFFYVKNSIVYVYDFYNQEKGPLLDNKRLLESIRNKVTTQVP